MKYFISLTLICRFLLCFPQAEDLLNQYNKVIVHLSDKDSLMEVIPDLRYGTGTTLLEKINNGEIDCYYLIKNGKLYQKI